MIEEENLPPQVKYWLSSDSNHDCHFIVGHESGSTERIGSFRAFLTGYSEVFRAMLQDSELAEQGDIRITDIQPDTFRNFLICLYTYCDNKVIENLSFQNCVDLFYVTEKYLVTYVKEKIILRLQWYTFKLTDIFGALLSPVFFLYKDLEKLLAVNVRAQIKDVLSSSALLEISSESLLWILKLNSLDTDDVILWNVVLKWAVKKTNSKDGKILRECIVEHLRFIRFCTMGLDVFCHLVIPYDILTQSEVYEICKTFVLKSPPNMEFICNNISLRSHRGNLKTCFTFCVPYISKLSDTFTTHSFTFRWDKWNLFVKKDDDYFSIFLNFANQTSRRECSIKAYLTLINHKTDNLSMYLNNKFCKDHWDWGFRKFCLWEDVISPEKGYSLNDTIIIMVHFVTENNYYSEMSDSD